MPLDRTTVDPAVMNGQPCIRGMRLTVRPVLEALTVYPDRDDQIREYPDLERTSARRWHGQHTTSTTKSLNRARREDFVRRLPVLSSDQRVR